MNGVYVVFLGVAAFLAAGGVIWRMAIKPVVEILGELLDVFRGIKSLIEPDDEGRTLPSRVTALEGAMALFLEKLGPMVEVITLLATPPRRTYPQKEAR